MNSYIVVVIYDNDLPQDIAATITQTSATPRHYRRHTDFPGDWNGKEVRAVLLHYSNESPEGAYAAAWLEGYLYKADPLGSDTAIEAKVMTAYREFGTLLRKLQKDEFAPVVVFSGGGDESPARLCEVFGDGVYPASLGQIFEHLADFLVLLGERREWPDQSFFRTGGLQGTMLERALNILVTLLPPTLDWDEWKSHREELEEASRQAMFDMERIIGGERAAPLWSQWEALCRLEDQEKFVDKLKMFRDVLLA